jgi:hypothetical protein
VTTSAAAQLPEAPAGASWAHNPLDRCRADTPCTLKCHRPHTIVPVVQLALALDGTAAGALACERCGHLIYQLPTPLELWS